ncbi:MAG: STAS/SEC14 domain-containing protein [Chloroflexota bacterium]|nr:STAS/SEC14 domain-containing protein [Ardenticatenaceae bacterium]
MAFKFDMHSENVLFIKVTGDFTDADTEAYLQELFAYANSFTETEQLHSLLDATALGKVSPNVRRAVSSSVDDPRFGKTAVLGNSRFVKVLIDFLIKATSRENIRYFTDQDAALDWITANQ